MSPPRTVVVTAPGKLILLGEHSVVYGGSALVGALGMRARVEATTSGRPIRRHAVSAKLPDLGVRVELDWETLASYAVRVRDAWRSYAEAPSPEAFRAVRGGDPAHLVKVALGEVALELGGGAGLPSLELSLTSEIPIGSGFGSSAAIACALPAAALAALGMEPTVDRLARLALEVERRQHGFPSGADHNAVLRGGLVRIEPTEDGEVRIGRLEARPELLGGFEVYDTGTPAESTGEVVAAVRALKDRDPQGFENRLGRMASAVDTFGSALTSSEPGAAGDIVQSIQGFERCLEELEVVPRSIRSVVRSVEEQGGAAKLSGAGALSEGGAGSLLVFRPPGCRSLARALAGIAHYAVPLGAEGLRVEVTE